MLSMGMLAGRSVGPRVARGMSPRLYWQAARAVADVESLTCVTGWFQAHGVRATPSGLRSASPEAQAVPLSALPLPPPLAPPELLEHATTERPVTTGSAARPPTTKKRRRMLTTSAAAMLIRPAAVGYTPP